MFRPLLVLTVIFLLPFITSGQHILITYYSESGHTAEMAEAVAVGAREVKTAEVRILPIEETGEEDLIWADAIVIGSPVHSANVPAAVQEFIRTWPFQDQSLKNKVGAVFVTGGGISAGEELVQVNLIHTMLVFNMIIVGGPTWDQPFGASAVTGEPPFEPDTENPHIDPRFIRKAHDLGKRVAFVTSQFKF